MVKKMTDIIYALVAVSIAFGIMIGVHIFIKLGKCDGVIYDDRDNDRDN